MSKKVDTFPGYQKYISQLHIKHVKHINYNQFRCAWPICFIYYHILGARNIRALKVKCSNLDNGCQWTGKLGELETHLQSCDYAHLPCTNECKNNDQIVKVLRKDLRNHLTNECPRRQYQCPHCKEMGEYQERTTSHLQTCPQVKVQCPNDECEASIPRCEVSTHRLTCDYEPVSCKYAEVGCEERPLRKELKEHEKNAPLHLHVTTEKVLQLTQLTQVNTEKVLQLTQLTQVLRCAFTFKLTNFQKRKHAEDEFYGTPFYTSRIGYKMCISVDANGYDDGKNTHVSVSAYLMKGDNDDSLTWPFTGEVIFEILNQLEDNNHHKGTAPFTADNVVSERVVDSERATDGWGRPQFISHADLNYKPDKNCQYLLNDTLIFRVSVRVNDPHPKPWLVCTT